MPDKTDRIPRYQELKEPVFKSSIPEHLVNKLSDQEKWVIEALSRVEGQIAWIAKAVIDGNRSNIESDLRIQELQDWRAMISSKWAVIGGFLLMCLPILIEKIVTHFVK
jgi:hypothetical protein